MPSTQHTTVSTDGPLAGQTQVLHAALEAMVTIDAQLRIVMVNPAAQRMFDRSATDMIGHSLDELMPERFRQRHRAHVQAFMRSDVTEHPASQRMALLGLRANGVEFPFEASICKVELITASGVQHCCTVWLRDRSEEARLTQVIDAFSDRMRLLFELAPVAIWIIDGDHIAFANHACSALFGVASPEAIVGRRIDELLRFEPKSAKGDDRPPGTGAAATQAADIIRPDGSQREVEIVVAELPDHGRTFVQMVIVDSTERARERRYLLRSRQLLRGLSASIVDAREEERQRIARELHDELGQRLMALKLALSVFPRPPEPKAQRVAAQPAQQMMDMVDDTVAAIRRITMGLRPPMLDDLGLEAAVEWLVGDFRQRSKLRVQLQMPRIAVPIPPNVAIAVYRILQEALTNISRHSGADQVQIELVVSEQGVRLGVQDNGKGFPTTGLRPQKASFGLLGIRERVRMLGGRLKLRNLAQGGAFVLVQLPLEHEALGQHPQHPPRDDDSLSADTQAGHLEPWSAP